MSNLEIKEAQKQVHDFLVEIGYTKNETTPTHAFLHLVEEVGELARTILHKETKRKEFTNATNPQEMKEEIADIFWQTLKLASYLNIDLESAFLEKFEKNRNKG